MWIYKKTEQNLWTVGYYKPDNSWRSESDHDNKFCAAKRVSFLNGSGDDTFIPTCFCGGYV
jgi:hypothetical protein